MEFLGFIRPDGSVGARNHILIISASPETDSLSARVASSIFYGVPVPARAEKAADSGFYQTLAANPNVAGALVLEPVHGGGGEAVLNSVKETGKLADLIAVSASGGVVGASAAAIRSAALMAREASTYRRQATLVSRLVVGLIYADQSQAGDLLYHSVNMLVENNCRVVLARAPGGKKGGLSRLPVVKKLPAGGRVGPGRGVYEIDLLESDHQTLAAMASMGVQLAVAAAGSPFPPGNFIIPVVGVTADREYYQLFKDSVEMDLSTLDHRTYRAEDLSLLIVNEILATASGKLTKAEAYRI